MNLNEFIGKVFKETMPMPAGGKPIEVAFDLMVNPVGSEIHVLDADTAYMTDNINRISFTITVYPRS